MNMVNSTKCWKFCPKKLKCKKVDYFKNDMFGKGISLKQVKDMKCKQLLLNIFMLIFLFVIVKLFYTFQPDHYKLILPKKDDLNYASNLRAENNLIEHFVVRERAIDLLTNHCKKHKDFQILFCHNVQLNGQRINCPCFMICKTTEFFYNLEILETNENTNKIRCIESYASIKKKMIRKKTVMIRGEKGLHLTKFSTIPNSTINSCTLQHANDVSRGLWN